MLPSFVLIQIATSLLKLHITKGMTLDEGAQLTCGQEVMVSAVLEDVDDSNLVHLFSGNIVWKMKLSDFTLQEVHEIEELFEGTTGVIESAAYSPKWNGYMLARKNDFFNYSLKTGYSVNIKKEFFFAALQELYNIGRVKEFFNCATVHADFEQGVYYMITVDFNGQTLACYVNAQGTGGDVAHPCKSSSLKKTGIPNPAGVPASEFKGTTCEGMFIKFIHKNDLTWEFLYADKEKLRLWHDGNLNQSVYLKDLFGCHSPWTAVFVVGAVVIIVTLITVIAVVIVFLVQKSREFDDDRATTVKVSGESFKLRVQK